MSDRICMRSRDVLGTTVGMTFILLVIRWRVKVHTIGMVQSLLIEINKIIHKDILEGSITNGAI